MTKLLQTLNAGWDKPYSHCVEVCKNGSLASENFSHKFVSEGNALYSKPLKVSDGCFYAAIYNALSSGKVPVPISSVWTWTKEQHAVR